MNEMTPIAPTKQIEQLQQQLLEAYVAREAADEKIKAIRNVLSGIGLGVELQKQASPPVPAE